MGTASFKPATGTEGTKPMSLWSALEHAHLRIDYLTKICRQLVLESEPDKRRHLQDLLHVAIRHGMTDEASDGS